MKWHECESAKHGVPNHVLTGTVHGLEVEEYFDTFLELETWLNEHELDDEAYFQDEGPIRLEHEARPRAWEHDSHWRDYLEAKEIELQGLRGASECGFASDGYVVDHEAARGSRGVSEARISEPLRGLTPYERTKARVYATGNKWAIENFEATH